MTTRPKAISADDVRAGRVRVTATGKVVRATGTATGTATGKPRGPKTPRATRAVGRRPDGATWVLVPVYTRTPNGSHGHWSRAHKAARAVHREVAVGLAMLECAHGTPPLPVRVTLTRQSPGRVDRHDNLRAALKAVADAVAAHYEVTDAAGAGLTWRYGVAKGPHGVRIALRPARRPR